MRRFAIGDIHGCSKSLRTLIEELAPEPDDQLIFLGDYVDRGPDSRDVIAQLLQLRDRCQMVALRGNHEIMMLGVVAGLDPSHWLASGGFATLCSYGGAIEKVPADHIRFLRDLMPFHETEKEIFVHACYEADLPMSEQREEMMYWTHLGPTWPPPHASGKRVFVGHTPQSLGHILDLGYLVCLDTYCFGRGYLTAIDLETYEVTQVDFFGHLRRTSGSELARWLVRRWCQFSSWTQRLRADVRDGDRCDSLNLVSSARDLENAGESKEAPTPLEQLDRNGVS